MDEMKANGALEYAELGEELGIWFDARSAEAIAHLDEHSLGCPVCGTVHIEDECHQHGSDLFPDLWESWLPASGF